ncbi:MAG TPA: M48 family metallopeptidase, partial [Kofleriaceae bacterium]|nr:M48 family metallopeptidase [Kofleriaceae bacterium]
MVVMDGLYPKGPDQVPPALTRPSRAYRRHAYLAVAGLLAFVALYFALTGWFAWTTYRLFAAMMVTPDHAAVLAIGGAATGFFTVFMAKALIFIRRGKPGDLELVAADHPRLFAFLHRLADEARAPRPHRVFVSPAVTAGVFYDFSLINLLVSSRKNLVIGLGLVNVLTLGELKAVLAHEFGHFAQQTMAVGRWVYMAQQIAGHVVVKRDALDRMLHALSRSDVRIMWAGWLLRLVVWSIRSLVDTAFGWVVLAQRALGREMELQADLVAVSLTGSDALIHALHRLDAADDAMDRALGFASGEHERGKAVADLFAIQTRLLERTRTILGDPSYGVVPALPAAPESHRLFRAKLAQPPRMWSTHPSNDIREANAKRTYLPAPLDDRSGWLLFDQPEALRARVTATLYERPAKGAGDKPLDTPPVAATLATLEAELDKRYLDPRFHGVYLGRSAVRAAGKLAELYGDEPAPDQIAAALDALYPARLAEQVARLRELSEQRTLLRALQRGILEAPGGVVRHRGREHHRREIPGLLDQLDRELAEVRQTLCAHDRQVRTAHVAAARTLSPASEAYLRGVAAILHYADHRNADLQDAAGALQNVLAMALADGRVSSADRARVLVAADVAYGVLRDVHREAGEVELGALAGKLAGTQDVASFKSTLEPLRLNPPRAENLHSWLDAVGGWVADASGALSKLSRTALDELLRAEDDVARRVRTAAEPAAEPAAAEPAPPHPPAYYPVLLPGKERPRQLTLGWWGRFQVADGAVATAARFLVAAAIVGCVVWLGRLTSASTVYLINDLGRPVVVEIDGAATRVAAHDRAEVAVASGDHTVGATTHDGRRIETFTVHVDDGLGGRYVYNVAGAAALVEARAQRGGSSRPLVGAHWQPTEATRLFDTPGAVRGAASGGMIVVNLTAVRATQVPSDQPAVVAAHARWEPPGARYLASWLQELDGPELAAVIRDRLAANPDDIVALRAEQDLGPHAEVCARHLARAAAAASDPGWQYLAIRCIDDRTDRDARLQQLVERWPKSGWLAFAAGSAALDHDDAAHAVAWLEIAHGALPELRDAIADH